MALKAILKRTHQPKQTIGTFTLYDGKKVLMVCNSIELAWKENRPQISCIPAGNYKVVYRESPKYPRHYHILDVPNRSFILIHPANFAGSNNPKTGKPDLLGCIGLGNGFGDLNKDGIVELLRSTPTMNSLLSIVGKGSFDLEII
jgi:hypothetical protein